MEITGSEMDRLISERGVHDPAVVEAMVAQFGAPVYRLALSFMRDAADAEDAAQETLIRAAAGLGRYQPGTNFKAWLLTITANTCRMNLRKRAARRALQTAWQALSGRDPGSAGIETQAVENETRSELWALVDGLDEKHRLVVVLRLAHGLSIAEISQVLQVNEKTVYSRLYTALERLRAQVRVRPEFDHLWNEVQP
jgi:RNA polymerase sigma-70 factor (ECF subfamily)